MHARGAQAFVMECSSIGLEQGRCEYVRYNLAMMTNFTRDHLDYHGDGAGKGRAGSWRPGSHAASERAHSAIATCAGVRG